MKYTESSHPEVTLFTKEERKAYNKPDPTGMGASVSYAERMGMSRIIGRISDKELQRIKQGLPKAEKFVHRNAGDSFLKPDGSTKG
jgi:hypothetical protein